MIALNHKSKISLFMNFQFDSADEFDLQPIIETFVNFPNSRLFQKITQCALMQIFIYSFTGCLGDACSKHLFRKVV